MDIKTWKKNRNVSLFNFCCVAFTYGLSFTIYQATEFYYFRDEMKLPNADTYLGLSLVALFGSGLCVSFIASVYYDRVKRVRSVFIWSGLIIIAGNILYLLYYSPFIILVGQFFVGVGAARIILIVAELARLYEREELTKTVGLVTTLATLGMVLGPCLTFIFDLVDTHIGQWKLNVNNMSGIVMGLLNMFCLLLNIFTLKDLSKEYNLKGEMEENDTVGNDHFASASDRHEASETDALIKRDFVSSKEKYLRSVKALFCRKRIMPLYLLTFCRTFCASWIQTLTPIKASAYLSWTQTNIAPVFLTAMFLGALPTSVVISKFSKRFHDVDVFLYSIIAIFTSLIFLVLFPYLGNSNIMAVFVYIANIITFSSSISSQIIVRSMLAKMVSSEMQGITEAIRNACFEVSNLLSGLMITLPSTYMTVSILPLVFLSLASFIWISIQRDRYIAAIEDVSITGQSSEISS